MTPISPVLSPPRVILVSDLHFGANYAKAHPDREEHFCRFLATLPGQAQTLWILGDLFEFWMEYETVIPKAHFGVLHALRNLVDAGLQVNYLSGNHDFNLGRFFNQSLGLQVHEGPVARTMQGKRCLLLHGDGLAKSDWKYRLTKSVMRHPLSNRLFQWIHPDFGIGLAQYSSKLSRDSHGNRPRFMAEYEAAARQLLTQGHDVVVHGHTHCGFVKPLAEGLYVNSGEWLERLEYVSLENGEFRLNTYKP